MKIYKDLEDLVVPGGKRKDPLWKQVYGVKGDLTDGDEVSRCW